MVAPAAVRRFSARAAPRAPVGSVGHGRPGRLPRSRSGTVSYRLDTNICSFILGPSGGKSSAEQAAGLARVRVVARSFRRRPTLRRRAPRRLRSPLPHRRLVWCPHEFRPPARSHQFLTRRRRWAHRRARRRRPHLRHAGPGGHRPRRPLRRRALLPGLQGRRHQAHRRRRDQRRIRARRPRSPHPRLPYPWLPYPWLPHPRS